MWAAMPRDKFQKVVNLRAKKISEAYGRQSDEEKSRMAERCRQQAIRSHAKMTPLERSEIARERMRNVPEKVRIENARKANQCRQLRQASLTREEWHLRHERLSRVAKSKWDKLSAEERSKISENGRIAAMKRYEDDNKSKLLIEVTESHALLKEYLNAGYYSGTDTKATPGLGANDDRAVDGAAG